MSKQKTITLTNLNISQRENQWGKPYFIIFDEDKQEPNNAYFCFRGEQALTHEDFAKLEQNWWQITKIQLTYQEDQKGKKVLSFQII